MAKCKICEKSVPANCDVCLSCTNNISKQSIIKLVSITLTRIFIFYLILENTFHLRTSGDSLILGVDYFNIIFILIILIGRWINGEW